MLEGKRGEKNGEKREAEKRGSGISEHESTSASSAIIGRTQVMFGCTQRIDLQVKYTYKITTVHQLIIFFVPLCIQIRKIISYIGIIITSTKNL